MGKKKSEKIIVLVTKEDKRELVKEALRRDLPISTIVREAIQNRDTSQGKKEST